MSSESQQQKSDVLRVDQLVTHESFILCEVCTHCNPDQVLMLFARDAIVKAVSVAEQ